MGSTVELRIVRVIRGEWVGGRWAGAIARVRGVSGGSKRLRSLAAASEEDGIPFMTEEPMQTQASRRRRSRVNVRVVIVQFVMDIVLIAIVLSLMPGFRTDLDFSLRSIALLAVIYGLLNAFVRPALDLLLMPFVVQTYGVVIVIVDIMIF
ncbi:MAG: phage holin family protein, partial [Acidimicrobiia bacterium]